MNNFNFIAPFYDRIATMVFGNSIDHATNTLVKHLEIDQRLLIVGGGTGKILEHLPNGISVTFFEKSEKMLERARRRRKDKVEFICADYLTWKSKQTYDVILFPFFLDCFSPESLTAVLQKTKTLLRQSGKLYVTDFQSSTPVFLQKLMHLFFRIFASLEAKKLLDIHQFVLNSGFVTEKEEFFRKKMIFSRVYGNL